MVRSGRLGFLPQSQLRCFAMIGPARISRLLSASLLSALLLAALVSAVLLPRAYPADDLEQSLRSRYANKTLVLRGFYHGDKIKLQFRRQARGQSRFRRLDGRWGRARNLNQCFGSASDDSRGSADIDLRRPPTRVPKLGEQETGEQETGEQETGEQETGEQETGEQETKENQPSPDRS
jgi:hypothetical protein